MSEQDNSFLLVGDSSNVDAFRFYTKENQSVPVIRITPNGDFYVNGRLTTNDMEVYNGFKNWVDNRTK